MASGYDWASKGEYRDLKERELRDMNRRRKENIRILKKKNFMICIGVERRI
jgi:hypothetical protein